MYKHINLETFCQIPLGKLTWNPRMKVWKMIFLFKWVIFRFHVNFQGCTACRLQKLWQSSWHTSTSDPACMVTPLISEIKCRASSWFRTQNSRCGLRITPESFGNHIIQQIHHDICDIYNYIYIIYISLSKKQKNIQNDMLKLAHESNNISFKEKQQTCFKFSTTPAL